MSQLIETLEKLRKTLCGYLGDGCDCKFGFDGKISARSERTGCPELRQAIEELQSVGKLKQRIAELEGDVEVEVQRRLNVRLAKWGYVPKEKQDVERG
jgi:hypothetical protein